MAGPRVAGRPPLADHDLAAERRRGVRRLERDHPGVAERGARAQDARARPAHGGVPVALGEAVLERSRGGDRVALAAERLAGGQVPGEQAAPRSSGTVSDSAPGSAPPVVCT